MKRAWLAFLAGTLLPIVATAAPSTSAQPDYQLPEQQRAACLASGGTVVRGGVGGNEFCLRRTRDGGKICTGSSHCQAACVYEPRAGRNPPDGARATGQCQRTTNAYGCYRTVEGGRLLHIVCID